MRLLGEQYRDRRAALDREASVSADQQDSRHHLQIPVVQLPRSAASRPTRASRHSLRDRPQYHRQYHVARHRAYSYWHALTGELGIRWQRNWLYLRSAKIASTARSSWLSGWKQRDARAEIRLQNHTGRCAPGRSVSGDASASRYRTDYTHALFRDLLC